MHRFHHRSDFSIRLAFNDRANNPVSLAEADFDFWFMTRPGARVFLAASRAGITNGCRILDDGSVLVILDDHHLPPGQIHADLKLHLVSHDHPDGANDINLRITVPVELTDSPCPAGHHDHAAPTDPIIVNVTIPANACDLVHHVTRRELDDAIKSITLDVPEAATEGDIDPIIRMFSLESSNVQP